MLHLKQTRPRISYSKKEMLAENGGHFPHIVSAHFVLPDAEVLAEFVLLEEIDALKGIIPLLIDQPLLLR